MLENSSLGLYLFGTNDCVCGFAHATAKGAWMMEVMKHMTAKEILNLIDWLREQGFDNDKIIDCIETVEGKKKEETDRKFE